MKRLLPTRTRALAHITLTFALASGIVFFLLWGGWGLGFFLTVLLAEGVFLGWLCLPAPLTASQAGIRASRSTLIALSAVILDLAFCYVLYGNTWLKVLNFPIIFALCLIQYLLASRVFLQDWDSPRFWEEAVLSVFVRPFASLPDFGRAIAALVHKDTQQTSASGAPTHRQLGKILLGLVMAVPVLILTGVVLSSADPLFAKVFGRLSDWFSSLLSKDLPVQMLIAMLLLPFLFSFLHGGRSRKRVAPNGIGRPHGKAIHLDKTVLITFLSCINALYLLFASIQLAYLTGAFHADLPDGMTYAEYARGGFFELAAVSVVNLVLLLLVVKGTDRVGTSGWVVRIEAWLLISCSLVQWGSALFRMRMYVDAYGLTLLRFMSTAFMLLLLVLFALLTVKEYKPRFPLFKSFAAAMLLSLLLLNHVNSDAWVARYNVRRYLETGNIDTQYFKELSNDAVPAILELITSESLDPQSADMQNITEQVEERNRRLQAYTEGRWQRLNIGQSRALWLLEEYAEDR